MNSIKVFLNSIDNLMPNEGKDDDLQLNETGEGEMIREKDIEGAEQEQEEGQDLEEKQDQQKVQSNDNLNDNENNEQTQGLGLSFETQTESEQANQKNGIFTMLINGIVFIPNLIFIKPLVLFWNILLYPINYLIKSIELNNYQINSKTELIKHENILSNNIKSPSSSSKFIIPPPQRLFPLVRNPQKIKRKTLVLDLDETLIHSLSQGSPRTLTNNNSSVIEIKLNNIATLYHVHKRPYCDFFLKEISKWFDLYIFTASVKEYADPIIDWLELEIPSPVFKKRFYRNDCTYRNGVGYIKDLSKFFESDELKNTIILDNSPISYALHEDNAVGIEGWINDLGDKELLNLLPMLQSLSICIDVRFILGLKQGEKIIE